MHDWKHAFSATMVKIIFRCDHCQYVIRKRFPRTPLRMILGVSSDLIIDGKIQAGRVMELVNLVNRLRFELPEKDNLGRSCEERVIQQVMDG